MRRRRVPSTTQLNAIAGSSGIVVERLDRWRGVRRSVAAKRSTAARGVDGMHRSFIVEVAVYRLLRPHPAIVGIVGIEWNVPGIVTELAHARSRRTRRRAAGRKPARLHQGGARRPGCRRWALTEHGVIHRNISPSNILVAGGATAMAFASCYATSARQRWSRGACHDHDAGCTWAYAAPERIARLPYTAAVDVVGRRRPRRTHPRHGQASA